MHNFAININAMITKFVYNKAVNMHSELNHNYWIS